MDGRGVEGCVKAEQGGEMAVHGRWLLAAGEEGKKKKEKREGTRKWPG